MTFTTIKRLLLTGLAAVGLIGLLAGCAQEDPVTLDVPAAADSLKNSLTFQDAIAPADESRVEMLYGIDPADLTAQKVYVSTGATAEEIAVFEAKDTDAAGRVKAAAEQRIADQKESFQDYNPKELTKLGDPVIETQGNYVILVVCDDAQAARDAVKGLWG